PRCGHLTDEPAEPTDDLAPLGHAESAAKSGSTGRRSRAMLPDMALADSRPVPAPSTPCAAVPQRPATLNPGKVLVTRPCAAASCTVRSLSSRIRMVSSPETVVSVISLSCGGLSRSAVSAPETVL